MTPSGTEPVAVVFDVGETLMSEQDAWLGWAEWLGVPQSVLFAALGATVALRLHHQSLFEMIRPGIDLHLEQRAKEASGNTWRLSQEDMYPDALECLRELRRAGYRVGVAGNQPKAVEQVFSRLDLELDLIGSSEGWGVAKPDPAFFRCLAEKLALAPDRIVYVGDRLDNDVIPAKQAGMTAVFLKRGPWGYIQSGFPEAAHADVAIDGLEGLVGVLKKYFQTM
jgi:HAD superfamily hydrolase (TIGR01662 family)